ncbi:hypothetical protein ACHAPT_011134 [Fusarium lateritium]
MSSRAPDRGVDAKLPPHTYTPAIRHLRANRRWQENVKRVMPTEYYGWPSIYSMVSDLKAQPCSRQAERSWTNAETKQVARLTCWGLTDEEIGKLIGRTTAAVHRHISLHDDTMAAIKENEEKVLSTHAPKTNT